MKYYCQRLNKHCCYLWSLFDRDPPKSGAERIWTCQFPLLQRRIQSILVLRLPVVRQNMRLAQDTKTMQYRSPTQSATEKIIIKRSVVMLGIHTNPVCDDLNPKRLSIVVITTFINPFTTSPEKRIKKEKNLIKLLSICNPQNYAVFGQLVNVFTIHVTDTIESWKRDQTIWKLFGL